ncbi:UvrD-helicase domain-containing protein [Aquifex pyrophilus]
MGIKLTEEQKDIIKSFRETQKMKVNAYAGTGKTTTLRALAEVFSRKRFLVLTFNRSIAQELKAKMPKNCIVMTIHSLAFSFLPDKLKKRLVNRKIFVDELINLLGIEPLKANFVKDAFEAFCNSVYLKVSPQNLKKIIFSNHELKKKFFATYELFSLKGEERKKKTEEALSHLADTLEYVFFAISREKLPITHDYYLKLFQQNLDRFSEFFKQFDALLVDEGQDVNGVQEFVLTNAPVPQKLIVGDRHQQIYSWRGAINTLARLKDWEEKSLTVSFRFENDEIVNGANLFLKNWKNDKNTIKAVKTGRTNGLFAYVTRTNARLVELLAKIKEPVFFARELDEIFRSVREAERLLKFYYFPNEKWLYGIPNYLKKITMEARDKARSLEEFMLHFAEAGEVEYYHALQIADEYDIETLYEKARKLLSPEAKIVLTTAHSSKGLEFERVHFTSDFPDLMKEVVSFIEENVCELTEVNEEVARKVVKGIQENEEEFGEIIDEINLQYVALTRVIKRGEGPGYFRIQKNLEKQLTPEAVMEAVRKELKIREKAKNLWAEVSDNDEPDWEKLDGEFDF